MTPVNNVKMLNRKVKHMFSSYYKKAMLILKQLKHFIADIE